MRKPVTGNTAEYVIALYIRLSVEDYKVESLSIENQRRVLHQYTDAMNIRGAEVLEFVDNGHSGTNFERPAVQEMLDLVRAGKVNCIIVKDLSRFGRNSIEVGYFMERVFPLYGIRFISVNDDFDTDRLHGDTGGINVAFKYLMSEFYSRDLSIKRKSATYIKMKRGEYQSKICPYGYRKSADGRMEPDPETAPNVQFIFSLAHKGYTPHQIAKALFEKQILSPGEHKAAKGQIYYDISRCCKIWRTDTVRRILKDERYVGTYIAGRYRVTEVGSNHIRMKDESEWFKIPDHHPAIVSREIYEQVQTQLLHRKCPPKNKKKFPLREKVFCGCCRHAMPRISSKNRVFRCRYTRVDQTAPCYDLIIGEKELYELLYDILSKQARIILNLGNIADAGLIDVQITKQDEYEKQIQNCQDSKRLLYEQLMLQEIDIEEYKRQKAVLDAELNRIKQLHSILKAQTTQMKSDEETKKVRHDLAQEITQSSGLTQELADTLIERVYVYPQNQVEIVWKIKDFLEGEK